MTPLAAVSINNYFATCKTTVSHGSPDNKLSCSIYKITGVTIGHLFWYNLFYDLLYNSVS